MLSDTQHSSDFCPDARLVWAPSCPTRRNQFVRFRRTFTLQSLPAHSEFALFADTRYVAWVNGRLLASGPARFANTHPEFDEWELGDFLVAGENVIEVLVNFFGASSFQTDPGGSPSFIAWGAVGENSLETPGHWECAVETAWRGDSPLFSFAIGPVEICDTRQFAHRVWGPVEILPTTLQGKLQPFSGTPLRLSRIFPQRIALAGSLEDAGLVLSTMSHDPRPLRPSDSDSRLWRVFGLWIWVKRDIKLPLSCFWSDLQCNGVEVSVNIDTTQGNHARAELPLKSGWNFLCGRFEILCEYWAYSLGFPDAEDFAVHSSPDLDSPSGLWISSAVPIESAMLPSFKDVWPPENWSLEDGCPPNLTPARVMAWDKVAPDFLIDLPVEKLPELSPRDGSGATWVFSFEGELLGHIELDVEAPPGTILDVATDDWILPGGILAFYGSNPFTDTADRFILQGGRQRILLFHPRGGKFLQVTLRSGGSEGPYSLHEVFVRSRSPLRDEGATFLSTHQELDWAWPVAAKTLFCSADDSYSDSPWRERGTYIGDALVTMHQHFVLHPDWRIARRALAMFAHTLLPDGQPRACAPSCLNTAHGDYSLLWIIAVRDFWAHSGDVGLPEEVWTQLIGVWESSAWIRGSSGLLDEHKNHLFVDWGVQKGDRTGSGNAVLNILRAGAARALAEMARATGQDGLCRELLQEHDRIEQAIFSHLWSASEGRLVPNLESDAPALHANVLALYFQLGSPANRSNILSYLIPKLKENFSRGIQEGHWSGHLELYFFHFLLPALAEHGRPDLAEELVSTHYGFLRELGDDTLPECFCRVKRGLGSRCHTWSGAAATYAARYVAGIRPAAPGDPNHLRFDPIIHDISRVSARLAHPEGWILVDWEKSSDGSINLQRLEHPEGIHFDIGSSSCISPSIKA